jgi:hypothetical protein
MTRRRACLLLALSVGGQAAAQGRIMSPLGLMPASFVGEVAGPGGSWRWQLDFLPGGLIRLRKTAVDQPSAQALDLAGRYTIEGRHIRLTGLSGASVPIDLLDDGALQLRGRPERLLRQPATN